MNDYAGIVTRTIALVMDAVLLNVGVAATTTIVGLALSIFGVDLTDPSGLEVLAGVGVWLLVAAAYFASFWTLTEQTPGMRALRLQVLSVDGKRLRLGRALLRFVGMILAAIPLMAGYALILWDPRRQGLHDKLGKSVVRYVPRPEDSLTAAPSRVAGAPLA